MSDNNSDLGKFSTLFDSGLTTTVTLNPLEMSKLTNAIPIAPVGPRLWYGSF